LPDEDTPPSAEELAAAARERTRRQVHEALSRPRDRSCPRCDRVAQTDATICPFCGESYFAPEPPRIAPRTKRALQIGTGVVVAALLITVGVVLVAQAGPGQERAKQRLARARAAERQRLAREQRPHHRRVAVRDAGPGSAPAERRRQRLALVDLLESAITTDARQRVRAGRLAARGIRTTNCHALTNGAAGDEQDLAKPLGRYACEAVISSSTNAGVTSSLGVPFVGTIDFERGRLTWCKDNPVGAGDVKSAYAFVRLSRECTAARGPAFGSGYVIQPDKAGSR